jgi:hypothetical protein
MGFAIVLGLVAPVLALAVRITWLLKEPARPDPYALARGQVELHRACRRMEVAGFRHRLRSDSAMLRRELEADQDYPERGVR